MVEGRLDEVASTLARKEVPAEEILEWMDEYRFHRSISRRAYWCVMFGWLLVTSAAIIGCLTSWYTGGQLTNLVEAASFEESLDFVNVDSQRLSFLRFMPMILACIAGVLLLGGLIGFAIRRFPLLSWVQSAIDWSLASRAVSRLLSSDCTYPEAFQAARHICKTPDCRWWLQHQAARIEQGMEPKFQTSGANDATTIELLIQDGQVSAPRQWQIAGSYFLDAAKQRLGLISSAIPVVATLCAGLLVWLAIASTMGAIWGSLNGLIRGLSF